MDESRLIIGDYEKCKSPILSIMIPTYGRADYLVKAIDSALQQKVVQFSYEVVVVSNDPDDSLDTIVDRYKNVDNFFLYRNERNIGMVGNSNRCVNLARGKYIAFLHDDDYLLDNYLRTIEEYVLSDSKIKCFIPGRYILFENDCVAYRKAIKKATLRRIYIIPDLYRKKVKKLSLKDSLRAGTNCYFSPSCGTVFEKKAFAENGGFDNTIIYSWDFDFFLRFNVKYDVYTCSEMCAVYRMAENASLRSEVKYDFYDYQKKRFLALMKENHVDDKYIQQNKDEIIYTIYKQWPEDIKKELLKRGEELPQLNTIRWMVYKLKTLLYYYNHNLDIQRPAKIGELG